MACDPELQAEIDATVADLAAVRAAINAVLTGSQSYRLDTSQTSQAVTRADLGELRRMRNDLRNELAQLRAQCNGGAVFRVTPGF